MKIDLAIPLHLKECIAVMKGRGAVGDEVIPTIVTDSREARCGDLFIALAREKKDRIAHVNEARSSGAITVSTEYADISVENTENAFLSLAALYRSRLTRLISVIE
jgi:UDP-N-acetylmuramyl pentapeptide synthase